MLELPDLSIHILKLNFLLFVGCPQLVVTVSYDIMHFFNGCFNAFLNAMLFWLFQSLSQLVLSQREVVGEADLQFFELGFESVDLLLHLLEVLRDVLSLLNDHLSQTICDVYKGGGCNLGFKVNVLLLARRESLLETCHFADQIFEAHCFRNRAHHTFKRALTHHFCLNFARYKNLLFV